MSFIQFFFIPSPHSAFLLPYHHIYAIFYHMKKPSQKHKALSLTSILYPKEIGNGNLLLSGYPLLFLLPCTGQPFPQKAVGKLFEIKRKQRINITFPGYGPVRHDRNNKQQDSSHISPDAENRS